MSWFRPELTSSTKTLAKAFAMPELAPVTTAVGMTERDCFACFGSRTTWMVLLSMNISNAQMVSRQFQVPAHDCTEQSHHVSDVSRSS